MGRWSKRGAVRVIVASVLCAAAFGASVKAGDPGPMADVSITITNGVSTAVSGESVTYTITASNAGPDAADGAIVRAQVSAASWTCVGAGGATCTASGSGNIADTVNLPFGGSVTYTATSPVPEFTSGQALGAFVEWGGGTDPNPGNNSAWDEDTIVERADLSLAMAAPTSAEAGTDITYTLTLTNDGPSQTLSQSVVDDLPAGTTFVSATGPPFVNLTTPAVGAGGAVTAVVNQNVEVGAPLTITIVVGVDPDIAPGTSLRNAATASGSSDTNPSNNSASASTVIVGDPATTVAPTTVAPPTVAPTSSPVAPTTSTSTSTLPGQRATVTVLTSSASRSTVGQAVTFTATVTWPGSAPLGFRAVTPRASPPVEGGTVEFSDGDSVLDVVRVENGRATFATSSLPVGTHTITATFAGTPTAAGSSATVVQQVIAAMLPASR